MNNLDQTDERVKHVKNQNINRSTEDIEPQFFEFLKHDSTTLLKTGIRLARKNELIYQELADRGEI